MKKTITLLLLLVSTLTFAQVQKLGELSSGKFIDSKIIYEDHTDDVFGYFLLYESDRKSKEIYELEYVVLDKNLNKITSNTFIQGIYRNLLAKTTPHLSFVTKIDNELIVGFRDRLIQMNSFINDRYRRINLTDFKLSPEFVINDFKPVERVYKSGDVVYIEDFLESQALISTK